jgi:hypothetical protein
MPRYAARSEVLMILSHTWKFLFIKGKKVAGTSVEIAVSSLCGPDDIITPILPRDEIVRIKHGRACQNYSNNRDRELEYVENLQHQWQAGDRDIAISEGTFYNHMQLREVLKRCRVDLSGYRVFAIERSPYSKVLSWANWVVSAGDYQRGIEGSMLADGGAMSRFLTSAFKTGTISQCMNIEQYRNPDGEISIDLLRYSTLQSDFAVYMRRIGIELPPELPHVKKGLLADSLDPRNYFTRSQLDQLNEIYNEEFEVFGYDKI